jgi:hypothetical protein
MFLLLNVPAGIHFYSETYKYNVILYSRGNPLKFYPDGYKEMQQLWVNHQLPEKIRKEMEQNLRLMRLKWNIM